ncbi:hypothetical protein AMTR_s00038p00200360 [Amborella trichopoda]|uniref:Uncharacterized protein n=1 Tax=Amborella trichopoda TaxID=13333 RepID=U5D2S2_AMBTC|nr:hypothetical protein AMTR_s00038p00200360 [Amborella trichopoda]
MISNVLLGVDDQHYGFDEKCLYLWLCCSQLHMVPHISMFKKLEHYGLVEVVTSMFARASMWLSSVVITMENLCDLKLSQSIFDALERKVKICAQMGGTDLV